MARSTDRFAELELRVSLLEHAFVALSHRETGHLVAGGSRHRYPKCWHDPEVRAAVIERHRKMAINQAVEEITAIFGDARSPSKSALHRIWQRLDRTGVTEVARLLSSTATG